MIIAIFPFLNRPPAVSSFSSVCYELFTTFPELDPLFSIVCGLFASKHLGWGTPQNNPFVIKRFWTLIYSLSPTRTFVFNVLWTLCSSTRLTGIIRALPHNSSKGTS